MWPELRVHLDPVRPAFDAAAPLWYCGRKEHKSLALHQKRLSTENTWKMTYREEKIIPPEKKTLGSTSLAEVIRYVNIPQPSLKLLSRRGPTARWLQIIRTVFSQDEWLKTWRKPDCCIPVLLAQIQDCFVYLTRNMPVGNVQLKRPCMQASPNHYER